MGLAAYTYLHALVSRTVREKQKKLTHPVSFLLIGCSDLHGQAQLRGAVSKVCRWSQQQQQQGKPGGQEDA